MCQEEMVELNVLVKLPVVELTGADCTRPQTLGNHQVQHILGNAEFLKSFCFTTLLCYTDLYACVGVVAGGNHYEKRKVNILKLLVTMH